MRNYIFVNEEDKRIIRLGPEISIDGVMPGQKFQLDTYYNADSNHGGFTLLNAHPQILSETQYGAYYIDNDNPIKLYGLTKSEMNRKVRLILD